MKKLIKYIAIVVMVIGNTIPLIAQDDIPERPNPPRLVNDYTQTLSQREVNALEQKLVQFARTSSTQIAIAIVPSFNGYDLVEFTERLGEKWGVGQAEHGNGVTIVIRPKTRSAQGRVHIAVGYGLEGVIPDAIAKRIIENEMIPSFKQNNYFEAIHKSTSVLISLSEGEFTADEYNQRSSQGNRFGFIVPFIAIMFYFLFSRMSSRRGRTYGSSSLPLWALLFMGSGMGRGSHHGSWNSFSGGSDSFGGGFGGFGGGGFGGGGASGSW